MLNCSLILLGLIILNEPRIALIPPSPITNQVQLEIRCAIPNISPATQTYDVSLFLDSEKADSRIDHRTLLIPPNSTQGFSLRLPTANHCGNHTILLSATADQKIARVSAIFEVQSSSVRSTRTIDGAWAGIIHWSEAEGKLWNADLRTFRDEDWRELVRGMHELGMNIIVVEETFRNQVYQGQHTLEKDGYTGRAFYPSRLFPGRMDISAQDPIAAILAEADRWGMQVFLGVGIYAWFDFTPGSLAWHKRVASELWELYGQHTSLYGWYISEEAFGSLTPNHSKQPEDFATYREQIIRFFQEFRRHCHTFAPEKPIMLAPNCHSIPQAKETWLQVLQSCDIICPFGFHRMPPGDITGEAATALLQQWCDQTGAHLWMDMEVFLFGSQGELYPRPIQGLIEDLQRFPTFEKILCFQYPGLLNAPTAKIKPGGPDTVKLFLDYKKYIEERMKKQ